MRIFHLVAPAVWADATATGTYSPESLAAEGFVHFSFAHQVAATANRLYRDAAELVAVELDPADLAAPVRVEDSYGTDTEFPHVYGAIPAAVAHTTHPLQRDGNGDWVFSAGGAGAAASPDR